MESICKFLPWDTEFFGFRIASVSANKIDASALDEINHWCRANTIDCLYFLADSDDETVRLAEGNDFHLVDIRVTLECPVQKMQVASKVDAYPLRHANIEDIPLLQAMGRDAFRESRFYHDPCFPQERCRALYEEWIQKSCKSEREVVFLLEMEDHPVGYIILSHDEATETGHYALMAVAADARGRGIGRLLVVNSFPWFQSKGVKWLKMITQGRNFASQRLYQSCGFRTENIQLWYHKWFNLCKIDSSPASTLRDRPADASLRSA